MADPWRWWPAGKIAGAAGCPLANVADHWPLIAGALERRGILDRDNARGVIATVAIETASTFLPVREAFWMSEDWRKANHRYYPFDGRGYIQLTWETNYRAAGEALGIDLLGNPERAMVPSVAADILAWFWATNGVKSKDGSRWYSLPELCRARDWEWVRRVVQGGTAGLDRLVQIVTALGDEPIMLPYNPDARVDQQPDNWSCSIQSAEWLLRSIGRNPGDQWIQDQLLGEGIVTRQHGLMQASGKQLADWITSEYGAEMGFVAHAADVTFDDVAAGAGVNPTLIGGRAWNHWSGVRRLNADGTLALANPADGYKGVGQTMTRAQWDALGPWSAVYIDRATSVVSPPPEAQPSRMSVLVREIRERLDELERIAS